MCLIIYVATYCKRHSYAMLVGKQYFWSRLTAALYMDSLRTVSRECPLLGA
jgi:hypothetical protein